MTNVTDWDVTVPFQIQRAVIEVNGGCNYKCQMCPQTTGRGRDWLKKISITDFINILDQCVDAGVRIINLEGSGEPTLNANLPVYIKAVRDRGVHPYIYTNGFNLRGEFMQRCVDAGLALARFSVIGSTQAKYMRWMGADNFNIIRKNAEQMQEYIAVTNSSCKVASYHLITDVNKVEEEVVQYRKNFIEPVGSIAEVWKMHNWSGSYQPINGRVGKKRSCGRPFAPELTIRAGGKDGTTLTVAPCCQTLGKDAEADLGSVRDIPIAEVWNGELYKWLRQMHKEERFDEVSFCKDCDFLYEDDSVLVYKNDPSVQLYNLKGTTFSLTDYQQHATAPSHK